MNKFRCLHLLSLLRLLYVCSLHVWPYNTIRNFVLKKCNAMLALLQELLHIWIVTSLLRNCMHSCCVTRTGLNDDVIFMKGFSVMLCTICVPGSQVLHISPRIMMPSAIGTALVAHSFTDGKHHDQPVLTTIVAVYCYHFLHHSPLLIMTH